MNIAGRMLFACLGIAAAGTCFGQETTIQIGMARSISNSAELMAIERGYFKEFGIKPEIELIESSANAIALLAQNRFQIVAEHAVFLNGLQSVESEGTKGQVEGHQVLIAVPHLGITHFEPRVQ